MNKEPLETVKRDYMNPHVPADLESRIKKGLNQGRKYQQRMRFRKTIQRTATVAAAASILFTVALNSSTAFATSFSNMPLMSRVVQVLTFKDYQFNQDGYNADITTPTIEGLEDKELQSSLNKKYVEENRELYRSFMEDMEKMEEEGGGHLGVQSGYEVMTDNERILSVRRYVVNTVGSSSTTYQYDTIDKQEELLITLPSLFKDEQYIEIISQSIKEQMIKQHHQEPDNQYWIEEIAEEPDLIDLFEKIDPEQNFYISEEGKLVISFDKYDVAPGYMGVVEFEIPTSDLLPILVSDAYIR